MSGTPISEDGTADWSASAGGAAVTATASLTSTDPARLLPSPAATSFGAHVARHGLLPELFSDIGCELEAAGLRGRGGAGFPTATKLEAVARRRTRPVVVANGTEGEPASFKDKVLLQRAPHLVFDGIDVVADRLRPIECHLCVDQPDLAEMLTRAHAERPSRTRVRISTAPGGYVTGEESALVHWLNGGEAKPTFVPPRPFERGVRGRPTFLSNVETFAQIGLIARYGASWYRGLGTADAPGTTLLTVTGAVANPGICEAPGGAGMDQVITTAGGPIGEVQAVLVGGYFGTWIPGPVAAGLTLDPGDLARVGASLGCGVIAVLPARACPLQEVVRVTRWLASETVGQCGPCVHGLPAIAVALERAAAGQPITTEQITRLLGLVRGRGACRHPDGVARFVDSAWRAFAGHVELHQRRGPCPEHPALLPTPAPERGR